MAHNGVSGLPVAILRDEIPPFHEVVLLPVRDGARQWLADER